MEQALRPRLSKYGTGSLRVSYFGDAAMLQGWLVMEHDGQVMEQPLIKPGLATSTRSISFWDSRPFAPQGGASPHFAFQNTSQEVVSLDLEWSGSDGPARRLIRDLAPGASFRLDDELASLPAGRIEVLYDGGPGAVAAYGWLEGPAVLARLPMATPSDLVEPMEVHSLALGGRGPAGKTPRRRLLVSLLNAAPRNRPEKVRVGILDFASGTLLKEMDLPIRDHEIRTLEVPTLPTTSEGGTPRSMRLRISSERGGVIASAILVEEDGSVVDVDLVSASKAHGSGLYPVFDPAAYQVATTFINLGDTAAQLFAQLQWATGTYALEPLIVPASGGLRLDFDRLLAEGGPDALGRTPPEGFETGFFQWISRRGSSLILAQTEARRRSADDSVAFRCFGCCEEMPTGVMVPEYAAFAVGSTADIMAGEEIETCSGTMGPYYAYPGTMTYSSPLSWTGHQVSSGGPTSQLINFESEGNYMWFDCTTHHRYVFGEGPVAAEDECQQQHHPGYDPSQGSRCQQAGSSTSACLDCCAKELAVAKCRCDKLPPWGDSAAACKDLRERVSEAVCDRPCNLGCP